MDWPRVFYLSDDKFAQNFWNWNSIRKGAFGNGAEVFVRQTGTADFGKFLSIIYL